MTCPARLRPWWILAATAFGAALLVTPAAARWHGAHGDRVGQFDYFVLSLSWSPEHCASANGRTDERQCSSTRSYGFVVHGLWPQSASGSLDSCAAAGKLDPAVVDGMLDLMPSPALVHHEWKKHGTCTGMPPADYFEKVRAASRSVRIPETYRDLQKPRTVDAKAVRKDFLQTNPGFEGDDLAVICRQRHLREVRVCLDKELRPTACRPDVRDQCRGEVVVRPVR
jgi:ribonuclease T2